jgi:hypothetical protein
VRGVSRTERGRGAGEEITMASKSSELVRQLQEVAKVGRIYPPPTLGAFEDAVDVGHRTAKQVDGVAVGHAMLGT